MIAYEIMVYPDRRRHLAALSNSGHSLKTIADDHKSDAMVADARDYTFTLAALTDLAALETEWRELAGRAHAAFFLSWHWIGCWLATLPREQYPSLFRVTLNQRVVGLALVTFRTHRWGPFLWRRLWLHQSGDEALDALAIEYNNILLDPAFATDLRPAALRWLMRETGADEFRLSGILAAIAPPGIPTSGPLVWTHNSKPAYRLELGRVPKTADGLLASLRHTTRRQLRQALRQYAVLGVPEVAPAGSRTEALAMLDKLIDLHQRYWNKRGRPGAFQGQGFTDFHRLMVRRGFDSGHVQLLHCTVGDATIGYLYNFVLDGHVYNYQTGFDYDLIERSKPGWVCHYLAIERALRDGADIYDFLAGASQFKATFANRTDEMVWISVLRDTALMRCALGFIRMGRHLRGKMRLGRKLFPRLGKAVPPQAGDHP